MLSIVSQRVYYVREDIMKRATSVSRDQLVSLGVCVGKFTHSDKFRLTIGALELLAAHAKHKVRRRRRAIEETITTLGPRAARPTPPLPCYFGGGPMMRAISSVFILNLREDDATRRGARVAVRAQKKADFRGTPRGVHARHSSWPFLS